VRFDGSGRIETGLERVGEGFVFFVLTRPMVFIWESFRFMLEGFQDDNPTSHTLDKGVVSIMMHFVFHP